MSGARELIEAALARYRAFSDGPAHLAPVLERFAHALQQAEGADAALEIGVRRGGTSAAACLLAEHLVPRPFAVHSVDPYGHAPYIEGYRDVSDRLDYGEEHYAAARQLLARHHGSILHRMDGTRFACEIERLAWWFDGRRYPRGPRFLAFAWLDGPHDPRNVLAQVALLLPHVAPGGGLGIDNADRCAPVVPALDALGPSLDVELFPPCRVWIRVREPVP